MISAGGSDGTVLARRWAELLTSWARQLADVKGQVQERAVAEMLTPASASAIARAEASLGVTLPPSLRAFYAVADGWVNTGLRGGGEGVSQLRPIETLGWFRDLDPGWLQAWEQSWSPEDGEWFDLELMRRGLLLTGDDAPALLLDPATVSPETGEWQVWLFDNHYPGAHSPSANVFDAAHQIHERFVELIGQGAASPDGARDGLEVAYRRLLAADLDALDTIDGFRTNFGVDDARGWRARVLHAQADAFRNRRQWNYSAAPVLNLLREASGLPPHARDAVTADRVLIDELLPLLVVATVEQVSAARARQDGGVDLSEGALEDDLADAVDALVEGLSVPIAGLVRDAWSRCHSGQGLLADFRPTPRLANAVHLARFELDRAAAADGNGSGPPAGGPRMGSMGFRMALERVEAAHDAPPVAAAWDLIAAELPAWEPTNNNHLGPIGLLWDRTMSRLITDNSTRGALHFARGVEVGPAILTTARAPEYRSQL